MAGLTAEGLKAAIQAKEAQYLDPIDKTDPANAQAIKAAADRAFTEGLVEYLLNNIQVVIPTGAVTVGAGTASAPSVAPIPCEVS